MPRSPLDWLLPDAGPRAGADRRRYPDRGCGEAPLFMTSPVLDAMARRFELLGAAERVDGVDRLDEGVAIVEGDLHFERLDIAGVRLELPRFDRLELVARDSGAACAGRMDI